MYIFSYSDTQHSVVVVIWGNGTKKKYRAGHKGKVSQSVIYVLCHMNNELYYTSIYIYTG